MAAPSPQNKVSGAGSSRKLLSALLCFTEERPTWTVTDLASELDLSVTSTYRYVALLREVGLLDSASQNAYRVTDRVLSLAGACEAAQAPLAEIALPVMTRVRDEIDETVLVARRGGAAAYCVDRVESRRPVRLQFDRGQAMSLHAGSLARMLLASMSTSERARYLEPVLATLSAARTAMLTDEVLDHAHAVGWTESFEEVDEGIWGCAAAITSQGAVIASVGTAAPIFRSDQACRDRMIELIRQAAKEISVEVDRHWASSD
ncbi:IclR family transcriptional regulator [Nocardia jinanensis]|uniref:IclR family transcriptional regulator n=1 Tax=Nocardia jinanensis TaxID=382504 RepID=A0A917RW77_9NOCA|nr:IclR family transcriptional regulator [Nocardia jinanensis]GGL40117.1 IclR family transcriptional regulator [Nocardia jinanensis]